MNQAVILTLALVLLNIQAGAQVSRLDTLSHLDVQPLGSYSAIWGYTAPDGREYAILGVNGGGYPGGTSIIDITDPEQPYETAFIGGPSSSWREMKTWEQYAYIVTEAGGGVQIIDLSELPDTARLAATFNYTNGSRNISRSHTISIHDGYMYLNGSSGWGPGGIVIFDLRPDPLNPVYVGEYQPEYIHDCYVLRDTIFAAAVYGGGGLYIADARNKSAITTVAKITYPGSGTHNAWVTKDRRYAITTDEIGTTPKTLKFWDLTTLPSVSSTPTSTFTPAPGQIEHNVTVRGDFAYVAWYSAGVRVVNVAEPEIPLDAGGFDTSPTTSGYNGVWGVYPYFPSGRIIAGDMQNGLWVFSHTLLAPRTRPGLVEPAAGDTLDPSGAVTFRWTAAADRQKDPHWYELRIRGPEMDSTITVYDTSVTFAGLSSLAPGGEYSWYVVTRDEWNTTASADTFRFTVGLATAVEGEGDLPAAFALGQNYPNPFNPVTTIGYSLGRTGRATLTVHDLLGRTVAVLADGVREAGEHRVVFDASGLASGVYLYRLSADGKAVTRRLMLVR